LPAPGRTSTSGLLARLGFTDATRARRLLDGLGLLTDAGRPVVDALAAAADSDQALAGMDRLAGAASDRSALLDALRGERVLRDRLTAVLGASAALSDHLVRHPADWRGLRHGDGDGDSGAGADAARVAVRSSALGLRRDLLDAVGADGPDGVAAISGPEALDGLRAGFHRLLLELAARDLTGACAVEDVAGELADLAGAVLAAALTVARAGLPSGAQECRLAVIAMGKCGGRELNYASDVDVVFVAEPVDGEPEEGALRTASQLAGGLMRACSQTTGEGAIWPVDANLRPEGRNGPLVRTLASHQTYYERWAKTWEFQALLKARPVAGDVALGEQYAGTIAPLAWQAADRPDFVADVQAMRRRVEASLNPPEAARELKLGPGGLRDVEFAVQLLQLVHGRADETLRRRDTLSALAALAGGGYVGREDAAALRDAYRFLRATEHRLQLARLRRTHSLPTGEADLRVLARSLGYRGDPVAAFERDRATHTRQVRRLHEKLFYRPLLSAVAALPADEVRLDPQAARARLTALGFADPAAALRHLEALSRGISRRASIQRTLLPAMLGWFADAPDPDAGLLAFRRVSEALGATPWYLRLLRDEGGAERLARTLATSRYVTGLLSRAPDAVGVVASDDELTLRSAEALADEFRAAADRHERPATAVAAVRGLRRRELLRIAAADLSGLAGVEQVGTALSAVAEAAIAAALAVAQREAETAYGGALPIRLAIIGMGRLGGAEQGYGSDADVLFVYQPAVDAGTAGGLTRLAHEVAERTRALLAHPAPDPPIALDADLRPEGKQGPLVRSLDSYAAYYWRWSAPWERQALLRARPVAGDAGLGSAFVNLVDPLRWPDGGLGEPAVREIRRLKARMESERLPRGAEPALHTKLGPGGLSDVEWAVQLCQLAHAHAVDGLRTTGTLAALDAARDAGLVEPADAETLASAWRFATRVRNGVLLSQGRPSDRIPVETRALAGVAAAVGYPAGHGGELLEDYRRGARRARAAMERLFYP
jgi:glutamate-ammonia-ligase adenylyltransferase